MKTHLSIPSRGLGLGLGLGLPRLGSPLVEDATQALLLRLRLLQEEEGWRCWGTHGAGGIDAGRGGKGTQWVVSILQCGEGKKRGVAVVERERRCSSHIRRRSEAGGGRKVKQMIIAHPVRGRRATNGRVFYSGVKRKGWGSEGGGERSRRCSSHIPLFT